MATQRIAVIAGDGIGPEVIAAGRRTLDALQALDATLDLEYVEFPWGSAYYLENGHMMPEDGIEQLADVRRHLFWRGGLAVNSGPCVALGAADSDAPRL